ncbi:hypothetical protein TNCV_4809261 [Trichonephila clavipes]|nr:hypothetical protein TNCV_4809261 [Trichonephila clavipes]
MGTLFNLRKASTSILADISQRAGTPLTIGEACLERILSPQPVTSEVEGDLWPANEKGRGFVHRPLVFKTIYLGDESPGLRELEQSPKGKETWMVEDRDWDGKKGETGGDGEPETTYAGGVGGLESKV